MTRRLSSICRRRRGRPPRAHVEANVSECLLAAAADTNVFLGACLDTGAERTVIGRRQAAAYAHFAGKELHLAEPKNAAFRFGGSDYPSLGVLSIRVPLAGDLFLPMDVDVVDVSVPFLFGLDALDANEMYVNTVTNELVCVAYKLSVPVTRKYGHVFLEWSRDTLYTMVEAERLHRHFCHPAPERLFAVLRQANDPHANKETLSRLEEVTATCDTCQRLAKEPTRFRVALPAEDIVFNRTVLVDLMWLESEPVLHVVDKDTGFNAGAFMRDGETADAAWSLYLRIWVYPYAGHPDAMHTDQGPQLTSAKWRALLQAVGTKHIESGIESHNALGSGERYHAFLRQIYRRVRADHPTLAAEHALSLAVSAMNNTAGPAGLVPTLLVFGIVPRTAISPVDLPAQKVRLEAMRTARDEMRRTVARARLRAALRMRVPRAADADVAAGMAVLVFREKPVNSWVGPYTVIKADGKLVWIDVDGTAKLFSVDKVKQYRHSAVPGAKGGESDQISPDGSDNAAPPRPEDGELSVREVGDEELDQLMDAKRTGDQLLRDLCNGLHTFSETAPPSEHIFSPSGVLITEVLTEGDVRIQSEPFRASTQREVDGLLGRGTMKVIKKRSLPKGANIVGGRFVHTLKHVGSPKEQPKSRYVAQGYKDRDKRFVVHNLSTLRQRSTKMVVSTSAVRGYRLFAHDVNQSYLQSMENMTRDVYLQPRAADREYFGIGEDEVLQLVRPLYGICDAGDYWAATFTAHVENDLGMAPTTGDPALYVRDGADGVEGLLGTYVDDSILGGNETFQVLTEATLRQFDAKPRQWDNFEFLGVTIASARGPDWCIELTQTNYIAALNPMNLSATYEEFASVRAAVAWLSHTRPDLCCAINRAAQATPKSYCTRHIRDLNKAIKRAKSTSDWALIYRPLRRRSLRLKVYADASFASNDDGSSQLGYIILLCDDRGACHVLSYSSKKSRRVVRSIMAGEVYAFANAFDEAFVIKHDLERIYHQHVPLIMLTDSKQLFDVITRASHPTEKRLMIDVAAAREAYNNQEISNVGLLKSEHNAADGLTKPHHCTALERIMSTGEDNNPVQQWIIRAAATPKPSEEERGECG